MRGARDAQRLEWLLRTMSHTAATAADSSTARPGQASPGPRTENMDRGEPVSLGADQLDGEPVRRADRGVRVMAWVPWTDGRYHLVEAFAGEWTSTAVHLRWHEPGDLLRDVWVWAAAVRRLRPDR